ncbi:hypothetical protein ACHAWF_014389 [Thalassiosira exigua]
MQTSGGVKNLSTLSLLSQILRTEGISSVYKGVGPPLLSLSIVNTLSFTSYSYFRQNVFHGRDSWDFKNALSGMMGAPLFGIVTTPENFLKTQMQLDNVQGEREKEKKRLQTNQCKPNAVIGKQTQQLMNGRFTSSFHCARTLVSVHGLPVLYTGHVINTVREGFFVGTYFFCYEGYKGEFQTALSGLQNLVLGGAERSISGDDFWFTSLAIPMAGGCAGATAWAFTFPLDCVRASIQGQPIPTESALPLNKRGAFETLKQLLQSKGFAGLYAGVAPSIARAFLVSGSRFSAYESALWLCRWSGLTSGGRGKYDEEGPGAYDD